MQLLTGEGPADAWIMAAGMMIPAALAAARTLGDNGLAVSVLNVPVIKPLDADTVVAEARRSRVIVTAENHTVLGGLGSAVAEALAEAESATPLRRVGIGDVFGESGSGEYLFTRYELSTQNIVDKVWRALATNCRVPTVATADSAAGEYAPV
jgi:transketolase